MIRTLTEHYITNLKDIFDSVEWERLERIVDCLYYAYVNKRHIFIMGNGGSAATASHFCCDLGKGAVIEGKPRFKVIGLNDNVSFLTAVSNDLSYEQVFEEQLKNMLEKDDVVIMFTASGNSPNIVRAVEYAQKKRARIVAFLGFDGGKVLGHANEYILVPCDQYGPVEDLHLIFGHIITLALRAKIEQGDINAAQSNQSSL